MVEKSKQQRVRELQQEQRREREDNDHVMTPEEIKRLLSDFEWMAKQDQDAGDR